jgi:hypothetical protein
MARCYFHDLKQFSKPFAKQKPSRRFHKIFAPRKTVAAPPSAIKMLKPGKRSWTGRKKTLLNKISKCLGATAHYQRD